MGDAQLDGLDYYSLLGVRRDAEPPELRHAFRRFAEKYHPDRFARSDRAKRERATAIYRRGAEGMQVLGDPDARRLYDRALSQGILRLTADQRDGAARAFELHKRKRATPPPFASPQAQALYERANALLDRGDPKTAWRLLRSALHQEPGNRLLTKAMFAAERALRGR